MSPRLLLTLTLAALTITAQILTSRIDNARTGANTHETILTQATVNAGHFGKQFSLKTDGGIYAQPLYIPHLAIAGRGTPNVLPSNRAMSCARSSSPVLASRQRR
jgi:hypothetical protein